MEPSPKRLRREESIYGEMDLISLDLLPELECPVCLDYMLPPITMCDNGHNICSSCKPKLNKCPTCSGAVMSIRNKTLENLAKKVRYPCKYRKLGCQETFLMDGLESHQSECAHKPHKCPFDFTVVECPWSGAVEDIEQHIKCTHTQSRDTFSTNGEYRNKLPDIEPNNIYCQAVFTLGQVFFHINKTTEDMFFTCVQHVGQKNNASKFKYKFTFKTPDGSEVYTACHVTPSYLEETFENDKCLALPYNFVKRFMTDEKTLTFETDIFRAYNLV